MYSVRRIKAFLHLPNVCALLMAFTVSLFICGCTDDRPVSYSTLPDGNSDAVISLNIKQQASDLLRTRAVDENIISNLYILVYNGNGSLIGYHYLSSYTSSNSIQMDVISGTNCTIYAIANLGSTPVLNPQTADTESALKAMMCGPITTLNGVITNERLTMSGSIKGITLLGKGSTNYVNTVGTINISRLVAKNTFTVTSIPGINITGYSIKNLPKYEYLIARPNANESSADDIAVGDDAQTSEKFDVLNLPPSSINNLIFYMFENRRGGRVDVNGSMGTLTDQKEKRMYAPSNATYIEIYATGTPASTDVRARFISASYRIYLGADNCQNFNVKRNGSYNYIVNIYGATDIDTRVTKVSSPSNCYIVPPNRAVIFPVSRANQDGTTRIANVNSGWTTELLWTDKPDPLSSDGTVKTVTAQFADGTIKVETGSTEGNAVVVAKVNGVIVWSWHIWVTSYDPNTTNISYNNGTKTTVFMDRNLGAINNSPQNIGSMGLIYQWGRKDPFPGSSSYSASQEPTVYGTNSPVINILQTPRTLSPSHPDAPPNNIENSIKNPSTYYRKNEDTQSSNEYDWYSTTGTHDDSLWGGNNSKSVYDPSPEGWRVPKSGNETASPWYGLNYIGLTYNYGYNWSSSVGWYPASGYRTYRTGNLTNIGNYGVYWSASIAPIMVHKSDVYLLYFRDGNVVPDYIFEKKELDDYFRASGFSIRCVKE
ncbi:DUF4906 domain-containing protein [uncultured Bacteroides sp.]|uniref:DUF4906 domain-containing protein n=1 Tax=uncultured Bacteroides sp. TaxID=162156 RepID=UPI002AA5FA62|nr:DUF4906 domain-containing protein [uncultured Bacteroides sp.]